ncbi:MAG: Rrf2 family transcriptional regulator [SAR202 cluster bacterium]|nr:Rrf2 family transcriptional regulator [SAR202 cluster bacterium]
MHVPVQVDYGIRALVDLAEHAPEAPVHAADIARRQGIPEPFLARVLLTLNRSGFVSSQRGPQGGHTLAQEPSEITMGMVVDSLGGSSSLVSCLDDLKNCGIYANCTQREVWRVVEEATRKILDSTSIRDLAERVSAAKLQVLGVG